MEVLVTRPEPDDARTATALQALGHRPILARLIAIETAEQDFSGAEPDWLCATSAHALDRLDDSLRARWSHRPIGLVGRRSAAHAGSLGWSRALAGPGDAAGLADRLIGETAPGSRILYLAGEPRKATLETRLREGGRMLDVLLVYRARPVALLPDAARLWLQKRPHGAVLHFSRASAEAFALLAMGANLRDEASRLAHLCLSADVALGLSTLDGPRIIVSDQATEAALLAALGPA
jgi:uroporphyrinogen-III synthase